MVPPFRSIAAAFRDGVFRIPSDCLKPLIHFRFAALVSRSMRVHEAPYDSNADGLLILQRCTHTPRFVLPRSLWATASRPLIEESRLRLHLLNSVGEPGGGVEN